MALYSAKEAKWYRRNVERREHRQFNSLPLPLPHHQVFLFLRFRCRTFVTVFFSSLFFFTVESLNRLLNSKARILFLFTAPLIQETFPRSTPQPKVGFNYITCYSCQATRGYKTYEPGLYLTGAITSTKSITHGTM